MCTMLFLEKVTGIYTCCFLVCLKKHGVGFAIN